MTLQNAVPLDQFYHSPYKQTYYKTHPIILVLRDLKSHF